MVSKRLNKSDSNAAQGFVQFKRINPKLAKLHLDLENPRHEPAASEEEAIAWIYQHEKVEALIVDIVNKRAMSPLDVIGVIAMSGNPGHYIAVEGNRRLCALMLLNDPDRAPTSGARAVLNELSRQVSLPNAIEVIEFESRQQASHWIGLRHLGPQEGQGVVSWSPTQKTRAAGEGATNALAVAVLDRAREGRWLGDDKPPAVTTLTRYLKNREVRAALGLGHHRDLVFTHDHGEVDAALLQFLKDAAPTGTGEPSRVNSRSNDADRAAYAREFRERGVAPRSALPVPEVPPLASPVSARGRTGSRNRPDPGKRKYLVPTGFVCNASDKNLRMLFKEMQRTPIDDHEFATAYLLRALVERVMKEYLGKVDRGYNAPDDKALVTRCLLTLDPTGNAPKFKAMRTSISKADVSYSLHTLGSAVHLGIIKDRRALISAWANWEHALEQMLEAISKP